MVMEVWGGGDSDSQAMGLYAYLQTRLQERKGDEQQKLGVKYGGLGAVIFLCLVAYLTLAYSVLKTQTNVSLVF
jgi:hypothetical protein